MKRKNKVYDWFKLFFKTTQGGKIDWNEVKKLCEKKKVDFDLVQVIWAEVQCGLDV